MIKYLNIILIFSKYFETLDILAKPEIESYQMFSLNLEVSMLESAYRKPYFARITLCSRCLVCTLKRRV